MHLLHPCFTTPDGSLINLWLCHCRILSRSVFVIASPPVPPPTPTVSPPLLSPPGSVRWPALALVCGETEPLLHRIFHQQQQITTGVKQGESSSRHAQSVEASGGGAARSGFSRRCRKPHNTKPIPLIMYKPPSGIHCPK